MTPRSRRRPIDTDSPGDAPPPSASVVITYHNEGEMLRRAVASAQGQDYAGPVEVIVVDDASAWRPDLPDRAGRSPRGLRSDRNIRLPAARNLGLRASTGEYVCFLDADDEFLPGKLTAQVGFLRDHPGVPVVGGPYHVSEGDRHWLQVPEVVENCYPELAGRACTLPDRVRHDACLHYLFQIGAATFRRAGLEAIGGFDESLGYCSEDSDLYVRLAQSSPIGYLPTPSMRYLRHGGSGTTTPRPEKYASAAEALAEWHRSVVGLPRGHLAILRGRRRHWHLLAAQMYLERGGSPSSALAHSLRSLAVLPSVWGCRSTVRSCLHLLASPWRRRPGGAA